MSEPTNEELSARAKDGFLWYVIPAEIYEDERLSAEEILLFGLVANLANKTGYCYASNQWLGKKRGVDDRTVRRWLEGLEKHGYIKRDLPTKGEAEPRRIYIVTRGRTFDAPPRTNDAEGRTKLSHPSDKVVQPPPDKIGHQVREDKVLKETTPSPTSPNQKSSVSPAPLPKKGGGPLNPRRGGDRKSRMLESMKEEFGDGFTLQQFEAAWSEMQATPASEVRNPEGFLAHLLDKHMLCQGDPVPIQICTKARDARIEKHRQEAKLFASGTVVPSELTVFVKTSKGSCLIPYDLEDDDWQRMTRGFREEVQR